MPGPGRHTPGSGLSICLKKAGLHDLVFLDEAGLQNNSLDHLDVLVISGGDTFAVAKALGRGAVHISGSLSIPEGFTLAHVPVAYLAHEIKQDTFEPV